MKYDIYKKINDRMKWIRGYPQFKKALEEELKTAVEKEMGYIRLVNKLNTPYIPFKHMYVKKSYLEDIVNYVKNSVKSKSIVRDIKKIEEEFEKLDDRQKEILKLRYGFEGKPQTFKEAGEKIGVTRERVRQIELKALRILERNYSRYDRIKEQENKINLPQPKEILEKDLDSVFKKFEDYTKEYFRKKRIENGGILSKEVDKTLEFSVRVSKVLEIEKITSIGDLVQKTESDLLKYRNFGKYSLNEVKNALLKLDLNLGMNLENIKYK